MAQWFGGLGFEPAAPEMLEYVVVDGYFRPPPVKHVPAATSDFAQVAAIDPLYTESLLQWLGEKIGASALP